MAARDLALNDPNLTVIISYAPAGLGHLRVSRALLLGLPKDANPVLLPDNTISIQSIHRITSTTNWGKKLMLFSQYGFMETLATKVMRILLAKDAKSLQKTVYTLLKQRVNVPRNVVIVATHFGIAHQMALILRPLEKQAKAKIHLFVQVTDDSPQKIWYVPNATTITVPSLYTKRVLDDYSREEGLSPSPVRVLPYPISPKLSQKLSSEEFAARKKQATPKSNRMLHVAIPISGASVGLQFTDDIMQSLHALNKQFHFHIIGKRTILTQLYFRLFKRRDYITVYDSHSDRQVVQLYDQAFEQVVMTFEITKPSEQAFKTMLEPISRGGVVMFFAEPVGRQEYDNVAFMQKHKILPTQAEHLMLYDVWRKRDSHLPNTLIEGLRTWRGFILPTNAKDAAEFINWLYTTHILANMITHHRPQKSPEVADNGVQKFWELVEKTIN